MASAVNANDTRSGTVETFITALVYAAVLGAAEVTAWLILHGKFGHIFQPRAKLPPKDERQDPLPDSPLRAIPAIIRADDERIIETNGLDGFLFVRFLKLMTYLFGGIAFLTWSILLPVYGTGSAGNTGLTRFTFGNVGNNQQLRLIAPLLICCATTLFILYMLKREYKSFIQRRQAFLTSKRWSTQAQSRTVLITGIPKDYCSVEALQSLTEFAPGGVRKIWLARDVKGIEDVYERRVKAVEKLEKAQVKSIKLADKRVRKGKVPAEGDNSKVDNESGNQPTLSKYIPQKKRPTHRLGKIPFIGKKVDTIEWTQEEIKTTTNELETQRKDIDSFEVRTSAFILFNDQIGAHIFAQRLKGETPLRMAGRHINVSPDDVIWSNLKVNPYDALVRSIVSWSATIAIIIFWSIPTAFVTSISNVSNLCSTVSWLRWLCNLPVPVNGIIQGVLPPLALALLFMLLPPVLRMLAKLQGTPLNTLVEHSLQRRFFAFLFIQGFIVATLASGIMAAISQITQDPSSTVQLLATNLPTASIFFLTLIVTTGFSNTPLKTLQLIKLLIYYVKVVVMGGTPRVVWKVEYAMGNMQFGEVFPAQILLVVIAISYSTIAPLITGFAFVAFAILWFCYKYQFLWVLDQPASGETGGLFFKTALNQMFAGLYIQHLCLIGLFLLSRNEQGSFSGIPQAAIMGALLVITIAFQFFLHHKYSPLATYLPESLADEMNKNEERFAREMAEEKRQKGQYGEVKQDPSRVSDATEAARVNPSPATPDHAQHDQHRQTGSHNSDTDGMTLAEPEAAQPQERHGAIPEELDDSYHENKFDHPAFWEAQPTIWLPRDKLGISQEAIAEAQKRNIDMTDEDARLNEKGKIEVSRPTLPGTPWPE